MTTVLTSDWSKVGGEMEMAEARELILAADRDGNQGVDYEEFAEFWESLHEGDDHVTIFVNHNHNYNISCFL